MSESSKRSMTLRAAISMGVGAMVGAGIFALLGTAASKAGNAVYFAFLIAGLISLLSGYSYAKLGIRYPSSGGIVEYLVQGYGSGYVTGVLSIILYLSVAVVMALVARAFGSYAQELIVPHGSRIWTNIFASTVVVGLTCINAFGADLVSRAEKLIVIIKISILGVFVVAGLWFLKPDLLWSAVGSRSGFDVLGTVAICLLAYHGFGVITNTVEDMPSPAYTLPRALYGAIGIVIFVYVGVAFAVLGNLTLPEIIKAQDYAMAEAARPLFGTAGFTIIAIAALLSAASSINANLYSTAKMTYLLARDGELPPFEARNIWHRGTGGLFTTAVLVLVLANSLDLSRIASLGSLVYLIVYSAVHYGHLRRLTKETGARKSLISLALITNATVLLIFGIQMIRDNPMVIYLVALLLTVAVLIEIYMQKRRNRTINPAS